MGDEGGGGGLRIRDEGGQGGRRGGRRCKDGEEGRTSKRRSKVIDDGQAVNQDGKDFMEWVDSEGRGPGW